MSVSAVLIGAAAIAFSGPTTFVQQSVVRDAAVLTSRTHAHYGSVSILQVSMPRVSGIDMSTKYTVAAGLAKKKKPADASLLSTLSLP